MTYSWKLLLKRVVGAIVASALPMYLAMQPGDPEGWKPVIVAAITAALSALGIDVTAYNRAKTPAHSRPDPEDQGEGKG